MAAVFKSLNVNPDKGIQIVRTHVSESNRLLMVPLRTLVIQLSSPYPWHPVGPVWGRSAYDLPPTLPMHLVDPKVHQTSIQTTIAHISLTATVQRCWNPNQLIAIFLWRQTDNMYRQKPKRTFTFSAAEKAKRNCLRDCKNDASNRCKS